MEEAFRDLKVWRECRTTCTIYNGIRNFEKEGQTDRRSEDSISQTKANDTSILWDSVIQMKAAFSRIYTLLQFMRVYVSSYLQCSIHSSIGRYVPNLSPAPKDLTP